MWLIMDSDIVLLICHIFLYTGAIAETAASS